MAWRPGQSVGGDAVALLIPTPGCWESVLPAKTAGMVARDDVLLTSLSAVNTRWVDSKHIFLGASEILICRVR